MHESYKDIRSRIATEPLWWDEYAVPRYEPFAPGLCADIYADEAVLYLIECAACGKRYRVVDSYSICGAFSHTIYRDYYTENGKLPEHPIADDIRHGTLHYGDPPNACDKDCPGGATMNCNDVAVLQYWHKVDMEWERDSKLEMALCYDDEKDTSE